MGAWHDLDGAVGNLALPREDEKVAENPNSEEPTPSGETTRRRAGRRLPLARSRSMKLKVGRLPLQVVPYNRPKIFSECLDMIFIDRH